MEKTFPFRVQIRRLTSAGLVALCVATGLSAAGGARAAAFGTLPSKPAVAREITGQVRDEKGEGLPGVNVVIKGTQRQPPTSRETLRSVLTKTDRCR